MKWLWCPLLLLFAFIEFFNNYGMCGSRYITGQMWFMWLIMSAMTSKVYLEKLVKCQ